MPEVVGDMTPLQQPDLIQQAVGYCKYQAEKGIDSLVALMERTREDWKRCLEGVSDIQAEFSPAPGEWTTKEVVTHFLLATASVNDQVRQITAGHDPGQLASAAPDERPEKTMPVAELSAKTTAIFDEIAALTRSLEGNPNLEKAFPHPAFGQLNILEWIAFQRMHGMDHMGQIDKNKADAGYPAA
ncbi:MAG TPA: DinB family protein [Dehalococcoidia bacterium]|nr:DinB family protein [Dehalococcoidia bacterium]